MPLTRCSKCGEYPLFPASHTCPPRWFAVMYDTGFDAKPPSEPFDAGWYGNTVVYTDGDAKDAAEKAAADYDASVGEHPDWRLLGVMPYSDYELSLARADDEDAPLLAPQEFLWYQVQCVPVPSYEASKVTL